MTQMNVDPNKVAAIAEHLIQTDPRYAEILRDREQRLWTGTQIQTMLDEEVKYKDWRFVVNERSIMEFKDARRKGDVVELDTDLRLRAEWMGIDAETGNLEKQQSRWWPLSAHMVKTEIIQTAFLCTLKAEEHEIRESFKYGPERKNFYGAKEPRKWTAPFNSHIHIDALAEASGDVDVRVDKRSEAPANQRRE